MDHKRIKVDVGASGDQTMSLVTGEEEKSILAEGAVKTELGEDPGPVVPSSRPLAFPSTLVDRNGEIVDGARVRVRPGEDVLLSDLVGWDISHWKDFQTEVVGFSPAKQGIGKKPCRDAQSQTNEISKRDTCSGIDGYLHVRTQTDFDEPEPSSQDGKTIFGDPYPPGLLEFVNKVTPVMAEALDQNLIDHGHFGDPMKAQLKPNSAEDKEAKYLQLRSKAGTLLHRLRSTTIPAGVEARCASWSPSGTQIAVAHGALKHEGFCNHQSVPLTIWALTGSLLRNGPLYEVPFDGCVTKVEFHPKLGNLVAFGFFNGDVGLIDLNGEDKESLGFDLDPLNAGDPGISNATHQEFKDKGLFLDTNTFGHTQEVTSLRWVHFDRDDARKLVRKSRDYLPYLLVSTSTDGYISLWSVSKTSSQLSLERRYAIHARVIPDTYKETNRTTFLHMKELGIQSLDVFKEEPTKFVCSTNGSFLFHGNFLTELTYTEGELVLGGAGPIDKVYDPEAYFIKREPDLVQTVSCNQFHNSLFAYVTLHGNLYIRNTKFVDARPMLEIYLPHRGSYDVKWSSRPMVFGVINDKKAYIYDLLLKERTQVLSLEHRALCRSLDWSKTEVRFLSVTDSEGFVNIWQLPEELVEYDPTEITSLENYADSKEYAAAFGDPNEVEEGEESENEEELAILDAMTRAHFPVLNSRIGRGGSQSRTNQELVTVPPQPPTSSEF